VHGSIAATLTNELTNIETGFEKGIFSVRVFASAATTLDPQADPMVAEVLKKAKVGEGKTIRVTVPIKTLPPSLATGTYHLLLETTDPVGNTEWIDTGATVHVVAPTVSFSASFISVPTTSKSSALLSIINNGNVNDLSTFTAVASISTDASGRNIVVTGGGMVQTVKLLLRIGKTSKVRVSGWHSLLAALPSGAYYLTVTLTDANGHNVSVVSPNQYP